MIILLKLKPSICLVAYIEPKSFMVVEVYCWYSLVENRSNLLVLNVKQCSYSATVVVGLDCQGSFVVQSMHCTQDGIDMISLTNQFSLP